MPQGHIIGLSGNLTRPSKTRAFVNHIASEASAATGLRGVTFDLDDLGPSFPRARRLSDLEPAARDRVQQLISARILIVGSPTYKGSYTGLFKHFFDLLDPLSLRGKPVILAATGGGDRHSLIVEHQLRPLFGFFEALTIPTGVYASDKDFADGILVSEQIRARATKAVGEAVSLIGGEAKISLAA